MPARERGAECLRDRVERRAHTVEKILDRVDDHNLARNDRQKEERDPSVWGSDVLDDAHADPECEDDPRPANIRDDLDCVRRPRRCVVLAPLPALRSMDTRVPLERMRYARTPTRRPPSVVRPRASVSARPVAVCAFSRCASVRRSHGRLSASSAAISAAAVDGSWPTTGVGYRDATNVIRLPAARARRRSTRSGTGRSLPRCRRGKHKCGRGGHGSRNSFPPRRAAGSGRKIQWAAVSPGPGAAAQRRFRTPAHRLGAVHPVRAFLVTVLAGYALIVAVSVAAGFVLTSYLVANDGVEKWDNDVNRWLASAAARSRISGTAERGGRPVVGGGRDPRRRLSAQAEVAAGRVHAVRHRGRVRLVPGDDANVRVPRCGGALSRARPTGTTRTTIARRSRSTAASLVLSRA